MAVSHIKSNTIADFTGTVTVFNSVGSTVTANATDIVRPSDWNSAHNQFVTLSGNTLGSSTISGTNIVLAGGNNITLSANTAAGAATISFVGADLSPYQLTSNTSNITSNAFPSANTTKFAGTGFTSTTTNGTAITAALGTNGLTFAQPQFLTTYVGQTTQTQPAGNIVGAGYTSTTQAGTSLGVTLNSNGLSLAQPLFLTTAQSPGAYLTTARASNDAIGLNTALTANGLSVTANSSGLSINVPAYLTTAMQSQSSSVFAKTGFTSTTQAGSTVGVTHDTNGLSAAWPPFITTYVGQTTQTQPAGNIAGVGTSATNASITLNSNGLAISVAAGGGGADGYNIIQGSGNTAGTMNTYASATFVLAGGNNITLSQSSNTMSIIGAAQTNQTQASGNIAGVGTSATNASITLNSNGLAISVAAPGGGAGFTGGVSTGGNTLGTTGTVNQQIVFVGGNNITLSQSSAAGGSATITIVGPAAGGGAGATINDYEIYPLANNTSFSSFSQNALYFQRIMPMNNVSMTAIEMLISMSSVTSSISHSVGHTMSYGIYTKGTGASSTQMQSMATSSFYIQASYSSNASGGYTVGQGTNSFTSSSAGTVFGSVLSGQKILSLPFSTSLAAGGDYYLCFAQSSASVGNTGAIRMSHVVQTIASNGSWGQLDIGGARISNSSYSNEPYMVSYSATSGAWAATLAKSDMRLNANSVNQMYALLEA